VALGRSLSEQAGAALPELQALLRMRPGWLLPLGELARVQARLGRRNEAELAAASAMARSPSHPLGHWSTARLRMATFRYAEAIAPLERLARAFPRDLGVRAALARCYGVAGRAGAALAQAEAGLRIDPEHPALHHERMLAARELGRHGEAREALAAYLRHREPDEAIALRARLRARHPVLAREHVPLHVHELRAR
jgi:tetratricopeptide (TPR) repeat protein